MPNLPENVLQSSKPPPSRGRPKARDDRAADPRMASRAKEENPFLLDDEEYLPKVPDTKDWHYFWMRSNLGDRADGKNIIRKLRSKFQYEIVKPSDVPEFMPNAVSRQDLGGDCIQFNDVVLTRCPQIRYRQYLEAQQIRTHQNTRQTGREVRERLSERFREGQYEVDDSTKRVMEEISDRPYETEDEFRP